MQNTILGMFKPEAVPKPLPRPDGGYLLVDLFCSIGGVSQAAKNLGHKVVLAIDYEAERLEVHRNNHPDCHHECIELGAEVFDFLNPVLKRKLKRVHEEAREADKAIIDVKRKAIEDFWSGAQGKGEELANAQRYASQRSKEEIYLDRPVGHHDSVATKPPTQKPTHSQPIRPEADSNIPRPGTTSPRHQRLMERNVQVKE